jgi:hypothetical protein
VTVFSIAWLGELGELRRIVAEDLHFDRLGVALEIAEHILQELDELDVDERDGLVQLVAHLADDRVGGSAPLTAPLQPYQDVAGVLSGGEQPKL